MPHAKHRLRQTLISKRTTMDPRQAQRLSAAVQQRVLALPALAEADEVLAYMPVKNEVDTRKLLEFFWTRGARVLLPRCRPGRPGEMDLACATCFDELAPGSYGIAEPDPDACPALDDFAPKAALVPGVAFDENGARIGFGGGYYDRLLADQRLARCLKIGLAYDFQVVEEIELDEWDVRMDVVLTENRTLETAT